MKKRVVTTTAIALLSGLTLLGCGGNAATSTSAGSTPQEAASTTAAGQTDTPADGLVYW
ncbi:MAG: carbohydrate ABC transporter substrate-binding protein, partial [Lachnospiraceae bacterium]|nr:carbohydrate ABC transporter substrate-binding protein [Lachnospiraceae bacterium]